MDEQQKDIQNENQETNYTPRPQWQVWMARVALALFVLLVIMYYINIARGGL